MQEIHQASARQGPDYRRQQNDGCQRRHNADRLFFIKSLLDGDITDCRNEADTGSLDKTGDKILINRRDKDHAEAGQSKDDGSGQ
ncbi:Uncharacterised protein [Klebsiella pneumoniae]|nr:Uncharacterised protein [Klebsiella pneumoniae]